MFVIETVRRTITTKSTSRRILKELFGGLALVSMLTSPLAAPAQNRYPSKPIKIVLGFSAGGGTDSIARASAKDMGETLGTNVTVDNKRCANGNIAGEVLSRRPMAIRCCITHHRSHPVLLCTARS